MRKGGGQITAIFTHRRKEKGSPEQRKDKDHYL